MNNKLKKVIKTIIIAILVGAAVLYLIATTRYHEADSLFASGKFDDAAAAYEALGEFKDSREKAEKSHNEKAYKAALALYNQAKNDSEKLGEAAAAFEAIKGYRDSVIMAANARNEKAYIEADNLLRQATIDNGKYEEAMEAFAALGKFSDAKSRTDEISKTMIYETALKLMDNEDYDGALSAFSKVKGYRDADMKADELTNFIIPYAFAEQLMAEGIYSKAAAEFEKLGDYRDAPKKKSEALRYELYEAAGKEFHKGNYIKAYNLYTELGAFLDSAQKRAETDEALWLLTLSLKSYQACKTYLSLPGTKYSKNAAEEYDRLYAIEQAEKIAAAYENALNEGTIIALAAFIDSLDGSVYTEQDYVSLANIRIDEIKSDGSLSSHILDNPNEATSKIIESFLKNYPGHKDEQKVRSLTEGDCITLMNSGAINLEIKGSRIESVNVTLKNNTKRTLTVAIPIGTYFAPGSSSVQNMVVREPETLTVSAGSSADVKIKTACMNIRRAIPGSDNSLSAKTLEKNSKLARVVALCNERNAPYSVTQAAVWIVTDNPGDNALLNTLVYSNGGRAISADDLKEAKQIVKDAG